MIEVINRERVVRERVLVVIPAYYSRGYWII
jgi:hypothetical protein